MYCEFFEGVFVLNESNANLQTIVVPHFSSFRVVLFLFGWFDSTCFNVFFSRNVLTNILIINIFKSELNQFLFISKRI